MFGKDQIVKLVIEGLNCEECVKTVSNLLQKAGVEILDINPETGDVKIKGTPISIDMVKKLIESAGYKIKEFNQQD